MENQDGDGCSGLMDNVFCQGCGCNYGHSRDDVKSRFDGLISDKQVLNAKIMLVRQELIGISNHTISLTDVAG